MLEPNTLCDCCSDLNLCLHSVCCTSVRTADTFQTAGVSGYWGVLFVFGIEWILYHLFTFGFNMVLIPANPATADQNPGSTPGWICSSFLVALYWAKLRSNYRSKFGGEQKYCSDFLCYWWCFCCSVAQDATLLDKTQGVQVHCCCNLVGGLPPQGKSGVGQPTVVMGQAVQPQIVQGSVVQAQVVQ